MEGINPPNLGDELKRVASLHDDLERWRDEAELVRAGQDNPLPRDILARRWSQLDEAGQRAVADRGLAEVVLVGGRMTVAQLMQSGLSVRICEDVEATMAYYRESLPLDGAQQLWVYQADSELQGKGRLDSIRQIIGKKDLEADEPGKPDHIVTGGRLQAVDGAAVISRLWDWMREGGEFSGGSSYRHQTRKYLEHLLELFGDWRQPSRER